MFGLVFGSGCMFNDISDDWTTHNTREMVHRFNARLGAAPKRQRSNSMQNLTKLNSLCRLIEWRGGRMSARGRYRSARDRAG